MMTSAGGATHECLARQIELCRPSGARLHFCCLPRADALGYLLDAPTGAESLRAKAISIARSDTSLVCQEFCLNLLTFRLHHHGCPVAKDLAHALHDLGGVVANADDGIRPQHRGVFQHEVEGVFAGFLAKVG